MAIKKVAAAIIRLGEKRLLTRRKRGEKLAGYWEFPGGKIEGNETIQECIEREIREELNIYINAGKVLTSSTHTYSHGKIELIALEAEVISGDLQLKVHDKADWVAVPDLLEYKLAPADIPIAEELIDNDRRNRRD
jgi:8-oxo-dGTP diphosphatase